MNLSPAKNNNQETKAQERQIQILKQKTGEERLKLALQLRELVLSLAKASIKNECPNLSAKELQKKLLQRIYGNDFCFEISGR